MNNTNEDYADIHLLPAEARGISAVAERMYTERVLNCRIPSRHFEQQV
jgi:hypothetical protein